MRWLLILIGLLASGCSLVPKGFDPGIRATRFHEQPIKIPCWRGPRVEQCAELLWEDFVAVMTDNKAWCLELGGSPEACQTDKEGSQ